jgi:hypothetical protein
MRYDPKAAVACLAAGVYDASIEKMEESTTKERGLPMIVVTFRIYADAGERTIKEWIVMPDFAWKLKRIAKAIDKLPAFESGVFKASDYEGEVLAIDLIVEESEDFGDQNRIKGYQPKRMGLRTAAKPAAVKTAPKAPAKPTARAAEVGDEITAEDVPF